MNDEARWDAAEEGAELLRENEVAAAITELERVIAADPDNAYAYYFLGAAHFEAGRFEKSLKAYLVALEKSPGYLGAMVHAGHALRMLGRYDQALRMGREVLARDPADADAFYLMGLAHYARGEAAAAMSYLERYLETNPEVEPAQEAVGLLQILRGQVEPQEPEEDLD